MHKVLAALAFSLAVLLPWLPAAAEEPALKPVNSTWTARLMRPGLWLAEGCSKP